MTDSWQWLTLDDVLIQQTNRKKVQQGWSPKCHDFPAAAGEWGVLKTTAVQAGRFEPEHNKALPDHLDPKPGIEVTSGDLLITCAGPRSRCGVPTLVRATPERLMMSGKMYRFRADDRLDSRFLELWLLSPDAQRQIDAMKTGISDSGLNLTHGRFTRLPVPVPPLAEQHRIVDLLEDHLSRLGAADAYLGASQRRLDAMERAALASSRDGELFSLTEVTAIQGGIQKQPRRAPKDNAFPFLRVANVTARGLVLSEVHRIELFDRELDRLRLRAGDLLVVEGNGSASQIGRAAIWDGSIEDCVHQNHLIRVRPLGVLLPAYLEAVWNSPQNRAKLTNVASSSSGLHTLSVSKLKQLSIPVPSIERQHELVAAVSEVREARRQLSGAIATAAARKGALQRALLTAAFSGRLTGAESDLSEAEEMINT